MLFYSHLKENFIYSRWEFYSKRRHLLKLFLICYILLVSHIILLVEYIDVDLYFDCPVVTKEEAIAVIPFIRCNSSNMDYMGEDHHQYLFRHVFYENKLFELFDLHQFSEANLIRFAVLIQLKYSMLFVLLIEFLNIFENIVRKELIRMAKVEVKPVLNPNPGLKPSLKKNTMMKKEEKVEIPEIPSRDIMISNLEAFIVFELLVLMTSIVSVFSIEKKQVFNQNSIHISLFYGSQLAFICAFGPLACHEFGFSTRNSNGIQIIFFLQFVQSHIIGGFMFDFLTIFCIFSMLVLLNFHRIIIGRDLYYTMDISTNNSRSIDMDPQFLHCANLFVLMNENCKQLAKEVDSVNKLTKSENRLGDRYYKLQSDKQMNLCTIAFHSIVRIDRMDNYDFSYKKTNFISVREIVKKMCRGKICFIEDSTYNTIIKYSSRAYIDALFCIFNHIFVSMQRSRQNILFFSVDINNDKDKMTFCIEVITHLRRRIALYDSVYLKYGTLLARKYLDNGRVYELRKKVEPLLRCQKYPFLLQTPHSSGNLSMKKTNPEFIEMLLSDYIKRSPSSWVWINSELQLRQPLLKQEIFRFIGVPLIELDLQFILETKPPSTKSKFKVMIIYDESFLRGDKIFDYLKLFSEQILIIGHSLSPFRIDSRIKYIGRKPQAIDVLNCITDLMSEPYDVMNGTRQNDLPNINYDDDNFLGEDKMLKWLKRKEKQRSNPGKL